MSEKIAMWRILGPRIAQATPLESEEIIEAIVAATNQSRGSILGVLSELDDIIERGLKNGRTVKLPNGTSYRPVGKKDGSISVKLRLNPRVARNVNIGFRGKWVNAENIDKDESEMITLWNEMFPEDPFEVNGK